MARTNYPFNQKDINFGTKLLSSLFVLPITFGASALSSASNAGYRYNEPVEAPQLLNVNSMKKSYVFLAILALACPIAGASTYTFAEWWMMVSYIVFSIIEIGFLAFIDGFSDKLKNHYIFSKKDFQYQIKSCRSIAKFLKTISILTFILNFYPILYLLLFLFDCDINHTYLFTWDGGELFELSLLIFMGFQIFKFVPTHNTYLTVRDFDTLIASNDSVQQIIKATK